MRLLLLLLASTLWSSDAFQGPITSSATRPCTAQRVSFMAESTTVATPAADTAALDWSFLDGVYLITCPNADKDGQRLKIAKDVLAASNLGDYFVKEFDTDDEDRVRGCYASHISVLRDALRDLEAKKGNPMEKFLQKIIPPAQETRERRVLVLEDNIAATGNIDPAGLQAIPAFADSNPDLDWKVIHLAYIPYVPSLVVSRTKNERITKLSCGIGSALGTTGYIITESGMRELVKLDDEQSYYAAIPDVMAELFPETRYAAYPTPFLRAPKTKSLVNPQLDDLREIMFQPGITSLVQKVLTVSGLSTNQLLPMVIVTLGLCTIASGMQSWQAATAFITTGHYDGPIALVVASFGFTIFSLLLIAQGLVLAPKPPQTAQGDGASDAT